MNNPIQHHHQTSWRGIKAILQFRGTFKKWPFIISIAIAFALSLSIMIFIPKKSFEVLHNTTDIVITVFPSLLGFSLGGFAIVVGFSNVELIKRGSKVNKYSVYQHLNAIFAINIVFQIFTTILAFVIIWIIKLDLNSIFKISINILGFIANGFCLFLLLLGSLYSLALTPYIVTNLFTLSQINNMFFTIQKYNEDQQKLKNNEESS